jgi:hypothetical protein
LSRLSPICVRIHLVSPIVSGPADPFEYVFNDFNALSIVGFAYIFMTLLKVFNLLCI